MFVQCGECSRLQFLQILQPLCHLVIMENLILITVDIEIDRRQVKLVAEIVGVTKHLLRPGLRLGKLKLDLARQAITVLQVAALRIKIHKTI